MILPSGLLAQTGENMTFSSGDITLAGTITFTDSVPIKSLAVLISVAGPTDRDLSLGAHKYFKKLAEGLAGYGIATIRYDVRGMGESGGNLMETTLADRASDARAAMEHLAGRFPGVSSLGFIGMSEGGGLGAMAASKYDGSSYVVMLSSPVRTGREVMEGQLERQLPLLGLPEAKVESIRKSSAEFMRLLSDEDPDREKVLALLKGPDGGALLPPYGFVPRKSEERVEFVLGDWYQSQVHFDVSDAVSNISVPLLAVYGEKDKAIDPLKNAERIKELNDSVELHMLADLNHLMQEANTGWPTEYMFLKDSFSDVVIELVGKWIIK